MFLIKENVVHLEQRVIEQIHCIAKKIFILVTQIGKMKRIIKTKQNQYVHMVMNVIEKILIILMNMNIQKNDVLKLKQSEDQVNVKVIY